MFIASLNVSSFDFVSYMMEKKLAIGLIETCSIINWTAVFRDFLFLFVVTHNLTYKAIVSMMRCLSCLQLKNTIVRSESLLLFLSILRHFYFSKNL